MLVDTYLSLHTEFVIETLHPTPPWLQREWHVTSPAAGASHLWISISAIICLISISTTHSNVTVDLYSSQGKSIALIRTWYIIAHHRDGHPFLINDMSQVSKLVISSDGCEIFAEGAGSLGGPTIILIHGLGSSTVVFNNLFKDDKLLSKVYLVSEPYYLSNYNLKCCRWDMTWEVMAGAADLWTRAIIPPQSSLQISWLWSMDSTDKSLIYSAGESIYCTISRHWHDLQEFRW